MHEWPPPAIMMMCGRDGVGMLREQEEGRRGERRRAGGEERGKRGGEERRGAERRGAETFILLFF